MDKEFLGLGITFAAVDEGVLKTVKALKKGLTETGDAMEDVENKSKGKGGGAKGKGGIFGSMVSGFKTLSIGRIGSQLENINDTIAGQSKDLNNTAVAFDFLHTKMAMVYDDKDINKFQSQMLSLYRNTGLTADQAATLADKFGNAGVDLKDMQGELGTVGTLVGKLGMDAGEVANMFTTGMTSLHLSAKEMGGLAKETLKLQKEYKLTDLMESLPEIVNNVSQNALRFGRINTQQSQRSVIEISKMAAAYRQVGMSQQDAVKTATSLNDSMLDMREAIQRQRLGFDFDPKFLEMQSSLSKAGVSAQKFMDIISDPTKGPAELQKEFQKMYASLTSDDQKKAVRFAIQDTFGDRNITNALTTLGDGIDKVNATAEETGKALGSPEAEFKKFDAALTNTLKVQQNATEAAKDLSSAMLQLTNKSRHMETMKKIAEGYDMMTKAGMDTNSVLGETVQFLDMVKAHGLFAALGMGEISGFMGALGNLVFPLTSLLGVFELFSGPLRLLRSGIGWISEGLLGLGTKILPRLGTVMGKAIGGLWRFIGGGLMTAFRSGFGFLAESLGSLLAPVMTGIIEFFSGPAGWIALAITGITLLIAYWKDLTAWVGKFSETGAAAMKAIGDFSQKLWDGTKDLVAPMLAPVNAMIDVVWAKLKAMFASVTDLIPKPLLDFMTGSTGATGAGAGTDKGVVSKTWDKVTGTMGSWFGGGSTPATTSPATSNGGAAGTPGTAMATTAQAGAPAMAAMSGRDLAPTVVSDSYKNKDFQQLASVVADMKDTVASLLKQILDKPVNVQLQGDARKFFQASDKAAKYSGSAFGLKGAVSP